MSPCSCSARQLLFGRAPIALARPPAPTANLPLGLSSSLACTVPHATSYKCNRCNLIRCVPGDRSATTSRRVHVIVPSPYTGRTKWVPTGACRLPARRARRRPSVMLRVPDRQLAAAAAAIMLTACRRLHHIAARLRGKWIAKI